MGKAGNGKEMRRAKKGLILKTVLERCRSSIASLGKGERQQQQQIMMPPEGRLSVCVGPERERFVIRTECVNHPLFRMLLEEAEMEFGYSNSRGPLELPCDVDVFREALREMEQDIEVVEPSTSWCCNNFGSSGGHSSSGYRLLNQDRY